MFDSRNSLLIKAVLALVILWGLVWGGIRFFGSMTPTPESIAEYVDEHPLSEIDDPDERREVIGKVADMLNQLPTEEIGRLAQEGEESGERRIDPRRNFFRGMNEDEQRFFMEKRVGKAFDQMMQAFNGMEREERKRIVERTLKQMRDDGNRRPGIERLEKSDPEVAERIINEGLRAYYQEADSETKLDLAPVLEQMQLNLGGGGHRYR
ncbi:MAG: hypothetical protein KDN19_08585 [Verrucomicrobiae bacterium]|nr:hypothetical protein [Verrucomicrobiae bacterium]